MANGTPSSPWGGLGCFLSSQPTAVADGSGLWVFVRVGDSALYDQRYTNGSSSGWRGHGGVLAYAPAEEMDATGGSVFVQGADNGLYAQYLGPVAGSWTDWQALGGYITAVPAAA